MTNSNYVFFDRIVYKLVLVFIFVVLACLLGPSAKVGAISSIGPDQNDFYASTGINPAEGTEPFMMMVVDDTGASIYSSVVSVYLPVGPSSWNIALTDADTCGSYDFGGGTTTYHLETYTPVDGNNFDGVVVTNCGAGTVFLSVSQAAILADDPNNMVTFAGGASFYKVKIRATFVAGTGGSNGFDVQAPAGGYVSYYSRSGNHFAVQDRLLETVNGSLQPWRYSEYSLKFAPSCDVTGPVNVPLRWFDDDWGPPTSLAIQRNLAAGEHYRMSVIERNSSGGTTATWTLNSITGGVDGVQSDTFPISNPRFTGDGANGEAWITVRPGHTYEWVWYHVRKANAVQFELPFDSIYWVFGCGSWDYTPDLLSNSPGNGATIYPNNVISITAEVDNVGTVAGPNNTLQIFASSGGGAVTALTATSWSQGGIAGGGNSQPNRTAQFRVNTNAPPYSQVCFTIRVTPDSATNGGPQDVAGPCYNIYNLRFSLNTIAPGAIPATGAGQTVTVPAGSFQVCNSGSVAPATRGIAPNIAININATAFLNGPNINTTQTIPTGVPNTSAVSGTPCWSYPSPVNLTIPTTASVGDVICGTISARPRSGYSNGTGLNNTPISSQFCVTVSDGPYLQVMGHDTWSGGNFTTGSGTCSSAGSGNITSHARPQVNASANPVSGPGVGAMDQYAAFALGNITQFGTANTPFQTPLSYSLAFANNPLPPGRFTGAGRCLASLFDGGGAGGRVDNALWNNATDQNNLNSLNQDADGQFRIPNSVTYNSSGSPFNNFRGNATILINGDLDIRNNIILNSNLNLNDIPFLVFIVSGNIRIQSNVTRIDGLYISAGRIDTCNSFGGGVLSPVTSLTASGACNTHLEVNGQLVANELAFRRTRGGTNEAATGNGVANRCRAGDGWHYVNNNTRCAAETIIFHPWFYLAEPHFERGGSVIDYPTQQLRDLPPIF